MDNEAENIIKLLYKFIGTLMIDGNFRTLLELPQV